MRHVRHAGDLERERLVLIVEADDDIGHYVIFDTTYNADGSVSNRMRHPYWFPDYAVAATDLIVLYTKSGNDRSRVNEDGTRTHFFYRNLDRSIWNRTGDCAVLLDIRGWDVLRIPPNESDD